MSILNIIRRGLRFLLSCIPEQQKEVTANIIQLAPTNLLSGRTVFITGGTSGIGFAIAQAMLRAGATVCITGRSEEKLKKAVDSLLSKGEYKNHVFSEVMDNTQIDSFNFHITNVLEKLGGKIHILVNNAGILGGVFGSATEEEFDKVMDTNLKGVFFLSQLVARHMKENHIHGNILNIASSSSMRPAASAYTLSKQAIKALTAGMAKSLISHRIVVNGLAPGPTATPMLVRDGGSNLYHRYCPLGRYATADEIGNMAVILTSGMGRTVVGSIVYMTGGSGIITYDDMQYEF